ncbi:hypothetical protein [Bacteroides fragilis]|uniref:hypothetical protein n=1 Tax=Bacteroides fragilis TaxID=817 RepID=UPI0015F3D2B7|nr:hypothetical protein [Bacteroides fragilis]
MQDIERVRSLARIAAKMDRSVYVLYEKKDGTFDFVPEGMGYKGKFIELVFY